jgi:hypothetical protein
MSQSFFKHNFKRIRDFLTVLQFQLIELKLNDRRVIQWTPRSEARLLQESEIIRDYCLIIATYPWSPVPENSWPLSAREHVFRFLVNWALTRDPALATLRNYVTAAVASFSRSGRLFQNALPVEAVSYFGQLAAEGSPIIDHLLQFHFDSLLSIFITACYTQPRVIADQFMQSIVASFDAGDPECVRLLSGQILLLALVGIKREHPHAALLLEKFVSIVDGAVDGGLQHLQVPKRFAYLTEAVFRAVFALLRMEDLRTAKTDLIEAVRPWTSVVRLLPTQSVCAQDVPPHFHFFAPYQFLLDLMRATEAIEDDEFRVIASLWIDLLKSPDHVQLIPLFVIEWGNSATKANLLGVLLEADPRNVAERLSIRCSFGYFYHITVCLGQPFAKELWFAPILSNAFHRHWDDLFSQVPSVLHFACLFCEAGARCLFDVICRHLAIDCQEEQISDEGMQDVVQQIVTNLSATSLQSVTVWGNEALKWLFGCSSLEFAVRSFSIYNRILQPFDQTVVHAVVRTVCFHLENHADDPKHLGQLVSEAFRFFTKVKVENETLTFNFVCAFLDCRLFVEGALIDALEIVRQSAGMNEFRTGADNNTISMIRPVIRHLETKKEAQEILENMIRTFGDDELMMIVLPIKLHRPSLFPSCISQEDLFSRASLSVLCKSLVHYSMILKTSSTGVLNFIYLISIQIMERIIDENNRASLSQIYQSALHSISKCPAAIKFIQFVVQREPTVASMEVIDLYEWDRPIQNVVRAIKRLLVQDESPLVTITDCHSFTAVTRFLHSEMKPTVLPFAAQREMLEGMQRIAQAHRPKKRSIKKLEAVNLATTLGSRDLLVEDEFGHLGPLLRPEKLLDDGELRARQGRAASSFSVSEFLEATSAIGIPPVKG